MVLIHPGHVKTDMGGPNAEITPEESGSGIIDVIDNTSLETTGAFMKMERRAAQLVSGYPGALPIKRGRKGFQQGESPPSPLPSAEHPLSTRQATRVFGVPLGVP